MELIIKDHVVQDPRSLAKELRSRIGPHPVPQSDPRARGLVREFRLSDGVPFSGELPQLAEWVKGLARDPDALYVLAVNENPPCDPETFLMRPHVDKRWSATGFQDVVPRWTTTLYLDFPPHARGGELVVFPPDAFSNGAPIQREGARDFVARTPAVIVHPRPGRHCQFIGGLPHAVLGYTADPNDPWRLLVVLAEFAA